MIINKDIMRNICHDNMLYFLQYFPSQALKKSKVADI